jgi:hypothetical protein
LPEEVRAHLIELDGRAKKLGTGTWAAAGQLSGNQDISLQAPMLALVSLLFRASGMPDGYAPGNLALWLREEGVDDELRMALEARGTSYERELSSMFVSTRLHEALIEVMPHFASSAAEARQALRAQYPTIASATDEEALSIVRRLLRLQSPDRQSIPLTLIVIDELQQYVGDSSERSLQVQNLVEACSSRFEGRLLVVATGQSALSSTANLQKLHGRFPVRVQLSEKDVHAVIGNVVLQKKPNTREAIRDALDRHSAEIDRQLRDTRIAPSPTDRPNLIDDYPLLPARHRLWEAFLREIDRETGAGQARSQLKVVQEATGQIGDCPLGWVIPTDALFDAKHQEMLQTALLSTALDRQIADQSDKPDGEVRARLLKMIFLIGQLPTTGMSTTGVRATPETLADLLIRDLSSDGPLLRDRVPDILQELVGDGLLQEIEGAYSLQTREGQEWTQTFRNRLATIKNDPVRIMGDRDAALRAAVAGLIKGIAVLQGTTKEKRDVTPWFGVEAPPASEAGIPVWIRDEWTVKEKSVIADAREAGVQSSTVFMFLPRRRAEELRDALAEVAAAQETIGNRPASSEEEALQAREAMEARQTAAERRRDSLVAEILRHARVFKGGGIEVPGADPTASLREALEGAATRRYHRFPDADVAGWGNVVKRANDGSANPLTALDYDSDVAQHPVCAELLSWLAQPRTGLKVRANFTAAPYGWPRDAIDGGLLALVADGQVTATLNGATRNTKQLTHNQIGQTEFARESQPLSAAERIALAGALKPIHPAAANEVVTAVPIALAKLEDAGRAAGGDAPLPPNPAEALQEIAELRALTGQHQLRAVYERREELARWYDAWNKVAETAKQRLPRWHKLQDLLKRTGELETIEDARVQVEAIRHSRTLVEGPDPTTRLIQAVGDALRSEIQRLAGEHVAVREREVNILQAMPEWGELDDDTWRDILADKGLGMPQAPVVGTDEELLAELDRANLATREERIAALASRAAQAREEAARRLRPEAVKVVLEHTTLSTEDEIEAYLGRLRARLLKEISAGRPVIV